MTADEWVSLYAEPDEPTFVARAHQAFGKGSTRQPAVAERTAEGGARKDKLIFGSDCSCTDGNGAGSWGFGIRKLTQQIRNVTGTFRTMCPMNCHPTLCGMLVEVTDGRVMKVKGDPDNPDSRGFLCTRGHASREIIGNPDRLLVPLVRDGRGDTPWRETSWDEALDRIAGAMRTVGPAAVGLWTGHGLAASNYGTRISSVPHTPLRQSQRRTVVVRDDDLLGSRGVRAGPHRRARGQREGRHERPQRAHRLVGRQRREPAQHRTSCRRGPRARRVRHHDRHPRDRKQPPLGRADRPAARYGTRRSRSR